MLRKLREIWRLKSNTQTITNTAEDLDSHKPTLQQFKVDPMVNGLKKQVKSLVLLKETTYVRLDHESLLTVDILLKALLFSNICRCDNNQFCTILQQNQQTKCWLRRVPAQRKSQV